MPRRARRESATGFYHIVSRGLDRENIFGEKREKTLPSHGSYFHFYNLMLSYC